MKCEGQQFELVTGLLLSKETNKMRVESNQSKNI